MTKVDSKRQKGNFAETMATSWLSRRCLVRHVSEGTDIGIDLYCESLLGESPYKHFWVQVKAIGSRDFEYGEQARQRFDRKHLEYWAQQPVPVYAMLVPVVGNPPVQPQFIFGIRLTDRILRDGLPSSRTITYKTTEGFAAESIDEDLDGFIRRIVPYDTAASLLHKGIIAPIDEPDPGAHESFPKDLPLLHLDKVLSTIRFASEITLAELVEAKDKDEEHRRQRRLVEKIALAFEEDLNPIGLTAVANSRMLDGDANGARKFLQLARDVIRETVEDPQARSRQLDEIDMMLGRLSRP